ncbi:hypothetical protein GTP46_27410 [Duganella sp. FT135W]|uniref:Uncharacterized protein n=1 Tax=Duganella flavida TaxID=2692175 RepID=A0A6L8KFY7_9BURK|nr:right-handed parallel beta-helix repeat-containing protein [Duganella flavida]MYM26363.1 hypothetical protein [Duganella flavida]
MNKPALPSAIFASSLALSASALAQQTIPDFVANNANASSPAYTSTPPGQWAYPAAVDPYSDDPNMRFRRGLPSYEAPLTTIATFNSIGIYWAPAGATIDKRARVQFRKQGDSSWRDGLPLWFDPRNREYRGSLVELADGANYEISLSLADEPGTTASTTQSTWSNAVPVGQTITLPVTSAATYTVNVSGTPTAYTLYTAPEGQSSTIDMGEADQHLPKEYSCVRISASYVIVRGLTLKNCQRQGIEILSSAHDVIIEKNDISGFGSAPTRTEAPASPGYVPTNKIVPGTEYEAGIYCENTPVAPASRPQRVIIQRNTIHDPRYGSVHWTYGHPNSAQAIMLSHCGSNHVARYNTIYSTPGHFFNDGIGGLSNFTFEGFPNADSDIYGNDISGTYDDAIESEGANRNVRIWGNYLHHTYIGIALATTSQGPVYAFRNVLTDTVGMGSPNMENQDDGDHGVFFKVGSDQPVVNGGRAYLFHNSNLQPAPIGALQYGLGAAGFINKAGGDTCNIVLRNNLMTTSKNWRSAIRLNSVCGANDFDYDAYDGTIDYNGAAMLESNGKQGSSSKRVVLAAGTAALPVYSSTVYNDVTTATYTTGRVFLSTPGAEHGNFQLSPSSLGYGTGAYLPNFNVPAPNGTDTGIDAGAHQRNMPKFQYGVNAYSN